VIGAYVVGWLDRTTDRGSHKGKRVSVRECRELIEGMALQGLIDVTVTERISDEIDIRRPDR